MGINDHKHFPLEFNFAASFNSNTPRIFRNHGSFAAFAPCAQCAVKTLTENVNSFAKKSRYDVSKILIYNCFACHVTIIHVSWLCNA